MGEPANAWEVICDSIPVKMTAPNRIKTTTVKRNRRAGFFHSFMEYILVNLPDTQSKGRLFDLKPSFKTALIYLSTLERTA
jgi:hypothetical protein